MASSIEISLLFKVWLDEGMWFGKIRANLKSLHLLETNLVNLRGMLCHDELELLGVFSLHLLEVIQVLKWTTIEVFSVVLDVIP